MVFKANAQEDMFPTCFFLSSPGYMYWCIVLTRFLMGCKNKAEGMEKWREEQGEKKKAIKKTEIH